MLVRNLLQVCYIHTQYSVIFHNNFFLLMTSQLSLIALRSVRGYNTVYRNMNIFNFHINIVIQYIVKTSLM